MEAVALFAMAGLGYVVTRLSGGEKEEGFEGSAAQRGPSTDPLTRAAKGAGPTAYPQELDLRYQGLMGQQPFPS